MKKLKPFLTVIEYAIVLTAMILLVFFGQINTQMIKLVGEKTVFPVFASPFYGEIEVYGNDVKTLGDNAFMDVAPVWNAKLLEFEMAEGRQIKVLYGTNTSAVNNDQKFTYVKRDGKPQILIDVPGVNLLRIYFEHTGDSVFCVSNINVYSLENFYLVYACTVLFTFFGSLFVCSVVYAILRKKTFTQKQYEQMALFGMISYGIVYITNFLGQKQLKISFTNLMYRTMPFETYGYRTGGPTLSDVADARFPTVFKVFVLHKFTSWNDAMLFGKSSNSIATLLNPFNWGFFAGIEFGQLFMLVMKLVVALVCMYILLRHFACDRIPSAVGAITFACCSTMVMWAGWNHSAVISLMPLLIWCLDCFISEQETKRFYYLIGIASILIVQLYGAMPAYVAYYVYMGFAFAIYRFVQLKKNWLLAIKDCLWIGCSMVVAALCSAAYSVYTFLSTTEYQEERVEMASNVLKPKYLRSILFPYWRDDLFTHMNEVTIFTGLLFLFVIVLFVMKKKVHPIGFWIGVTLVALVCIYVNATGAFFKLLPFINTSSKLRVVTLVNFSLAVLAGLLVDAVWKAQEGKKRSILCMLMMITIPIIVSGVTLLIKRNHWIEISERGTLEEIKLTLIICILYGISLAVLYLYKSRGALLLVGMLTCFTMLNFAMNYMPMIDADAPAIPKETDSIQYMQENIGDSRMIPVELWNFYPNSQVYYGLKTIVAHSLGATDEALKQYMCAIDDEIYKTPTYTSLRKIDSVNMLLYSGIKYVMVQQNAEVAGLDKLAECAVDAKNFDDGERVYELPCTERVFLANQVIEKASDEEILREMTKEYLPNAVFTTKQTKPATLSLEASDVEQTVFENDKVSLKVNTDGSGYLVLNEQYDKDWNVKINGETAEIEPVNILFRGVYLPEAGTYEITMQYENKLLTVCIWISIVGVILMMGYVGGIVWYVRKEQNKKIK